MMRLLATAAAVLLLTAPAGSTNVFHNGDFEGGFDAIDDDLCPVSWTILETWWGTLDEGSVVTSAQDNGPTMPGSWSTSWHRWNSGPSGDWTGIEQVCNPMINVSQVEFLGLTLDVKVLYHDLGGSGQTADDWEYPVSIVVYFTDDGDRERYWQHGYYEWIDGATEPAPHGEIVAGGDGIVYSTQVPADTWVPQSFDLLAQMRTLAEPKAITKIRIGGAGWNFEGQVDNVGFFVRPTPVLGASFGAIKALYR
jgi:hypothetical protein